MNLYSAYKIQKMKAKYSYYINFLRVFLEVFKVKEEFLDSADTILCETNNTHQIIFSSI